MRLCNLILTVGIVGLLAPTSLLAAEKTTTPAATAKVPNGKAASRINRMTDGRLCDRVTGSILRPSRSHGCGPTTSPYSIYTREDLQRTGLLDTNSALRKLDSTIR